MLPAGSMTSALTYGLTSAPTPALTIEQGESRLGMRAVMAGRIARRIGV